MDEAYQRFAPYRDSSLDRWHRKTMLMTGSAALRGNLKALNQSLSAQVQPHACLYCHMPLMLPFSSLTNPLHLSGAKAPAHLPNWNV